MSLSLSKRRFFLALSQKCPLSKPESGVLCARDMDAYECLSIKCSKCREFEHYDYQCPSKSQHTDNVYIDDIDNSKIVENVCIPSVVASDVVDELVKTSTPTLDETHVYEESFRNIQDALVESRTLIHDDIDVSEDDTSDFEHVLVKFTMSVQVARFSLAIPMIEDEIENETVDTSVVTSSKPYEFSRADCGYMVPSNFSSSSELVKFFSTVHEVTPSVFPYSECLELFSDFDHIIVGYSDVVPLAISDVYPLRKPIYPFFFLQVFYLVSLLQKCMMRLVNR